MEDEDLPYMAEYAKSSRSSCKHCKTTIAKDTLRIGVMIQSPHFDGKIPLWHHLKCFFDKKLPKTTGDIKYFSSLRYEDQQELKAKIAGNPTPAAKGKKAAQVKHLDSLSVRDFSIEYAKSSRSACNVCSEKIEKQQIRISKIDTESESAHRFGPLPRWHHAECFAKVRIMLGFMESGSKLPGFKILSEEDKAAIEKQMPAVKGQKKRKLSVEEVVPKKIAKADGEEEMALMAQSKLLFSYRDNLQKHVNKKKLIELLELNGQEPPSGESQLLDRVADCLAFGSLNPCPECNGQIRLSSYTYKCSGNVTAWTKCQHVVVKPPRRKFLIPEELRTTEYPFLEKYKYVKRDRIFPSNPDTPSSQSRPSTSNGSLKPMENFKVGFVGELKRGNQVASDLIVSLGGKALKRIDKNTTCIITTKEEAEANEAKIKTAEQKGIFVIAEEFLDDVKDGGAAHLIKKHSLYPWGGDPVAKLCSGTNKKFNKSIIAPPKSSKSTKSKIQKVKVVHGKVSVDPDSGLEAAAQVLELSGVLYNVVLGMVDIQRGTNSYYKLQALKHVHLSKYFVFRSWGRVGTTIGSNKLENFNTVMDAVHRFKELYLEKTDNDWDNRENFMKSPNRFYPLDIDYGEEAVEQFSELKSGGDSKLPMPVQNLICLICDINSMKKAMLEFEIDMEKMPLGKLSKKQIQKAYSVLTELQEIIRGDKKEMKMLDASNRFYTLIPHDFGLKKPPILNNETLIQSKTDMLDNLLEIEVAYTLLKGEHSNGNPIDQHYLKLKTEIEVLENNCPEFKMMACYMKNTHAETHQQYKLSLLEAFKINREGEFSRYESNCKDISNRKLLWHGSRITNFVGILSQGLRIAPPEAPSTGYMFGKGIYFADMVSKSANYCFTSRSNSVGILLLCEVALGNMYERTDAHYITKLPKKYHSTKGLGSTGPDPKGSRFENSVEIPMGKPVLETEDMRFLLYNEYIVYDINQVNIKYLLKVNFKWR